VLSPHRIVVLDGTGGVRRTVSMLTAELLTGAFRPRTHDLAVVVRRSARSEVRLVDVDRPGAAPVLLAGPGRFGDVAWSPNGRWLLVAWPAANQWVFVDGAHAHAVANIRQQFGRSDRASPLLRFGGRWSK
jgi:hypothetical protein